MRAWLPQDPRGFEPPTDVLRFACSLVAWSPLVCYGGLRPRERMRFEPKCSSGAGRIEADVLPPSCFIATTMEFAVVPPAQWDREFVTDLAPERPVLRKAQMVGVARLTAADQAGLLCDKPYMITIAKTSRFGVHQVGFVNRWQWRRRPYFRDTSLSIIVRVRRSLAMMAGKAQQLGAKRFLDMLGIRGV